MTLNSDHFHEEPNLLKIHFFPYCVNEWNNLKVGIRNAKSLNIFKKLFISEKKKNPLFSVYDQLGVKLLMRLRYEFSNLNKRKFRHGFKNVLNVLCTCLAEIETTENFLLPYQLYSTHGSELFDKIVKVDQKILNLTTKVQVLVLLYGSQRNNSENSNQNLINLVIKYLQSTGFDRSIFFFFILKIFFY